MSKYVLALILMKNIQYSNISSGQYAGVSQYIKTCYITVKHNHLNWVFVCDVCMDDTILYIYANQEVSFCENMAIQVELYICAFYTISTRFSHKYRFGRENGTTQQWLVVDSITIVF